MPPARARRRQQEVEEPEPQERASLNGDKDFTVYADKDITATMQAFADWLIDEVYEGELPEDFEEESFRKGVALGGSVRMDFQRSDYWAQDPRNRKNKQAEEEDEEEEAPAPRRSGRAKARQAEAAAPPARRGNRRGRRAEPEPEPEDEDEGEEDIEDEAELDEEEAEDEPEPEPEPAPKARRGGSRRGTAASKGMKAGTDTAQKTSGRRTSRRGGKAAASEGAAPY